MTNYLSIKWLLKCEKQLRELSDEVEFAKLIIQELDKDADLREQLSHVYVRALKTVELSGKK